MRSAIVPTDKSHLVSDKESQKLLILGSTGSIGESTLDVVRRNKDRFTVFGLAAGSNAKKLISQINEFRPKYVFINDDSAANEVAQACKTYDVEILRTESELCELTAHPKVDTVCAAIVGSAGLASSLAAAKAGKKIALANKESLVLAGKLFHSAVKDSGAVVVPVDSEHSAIFQALSGNHFKDIEQIILTASGGPFLNTPIEQFASLSPEQAIKHPRWSMGPKISVDSASLTNKALELIEAYWLFGVSESQISVVVHPQSIVHSIVRYVDGNEIAQLSLPDMRGPISYALAYPGNRIESGLERLSLAKARELNFQELDNKKFPAVNLARQSLKQGEAMPAVFCRASEIAVGAFLSHQLTFDKLVKVTETALSKMGSAKYDSLQDLQAILSETEAITLAIIKGS